MDFEALLLGIEPVVALGLGLSALAIAPVVRSLGNTEIGENLASSGRTLTKNGIKMSMEMFEKVQGTMAEAGESWNDMVAEAKAEMKTNKNSSNGRPKEVEIADS